MLSHRIAVFFRYLVVFDCLDCLLSCLFKIGSWDFEAATTKTFAASVTLKILVDRSPSIHAIHRESIHSLKAICPPLNLPRFFFAMTEPETCDIMSEHPASSGPSPVSRT